MMLSFITRSVLARSATPLRSSLLGSARTTSAVGLSGLNSVKGLNGLNKNTVIHALRAFSVSSRVGYAVAGRKPSTTKKTGTTKAKKTTTTTSSAAKKTVATKKKAAPKKKVATKKAATKKAVAKKRKVAAKKKPAPRGRPATAKKAEKKPVINPRTTPELRQPPRSIGSYSLYCKRMYPTLQPKPTNMTDAASQISAMWKALTAAEKKVFQDEASAINAERKVDYNKWRAGLSMGQVRIINAYRANSKASRNSLGAPPKSPNHKPKAPTAFVKFYSESRKNGTIDFSKRPEGVNPAVYGVQEASKLWKGMSATQKQAYM